jgi:hypothetical protein
LVPADGDAVRAQIEAMDASGIAAAVNLDAGRTDGTLPAWMELQKKVPGPVRQLREVHREGLRADQGARPSSRIWSAELERAAKMGIRGVKMWKDLGMIIRDGSGALLRIDDPRLDPFLGEMRRAGAGRVHPHGRSEGVLVPPHVQQPALSDPDRGAAVLQDSGHAEVGGPDRAAGQHRPESIPKTTFIGAHFGSMTFELQALAERLDRFPNFHVECAARLRISAGSARKAVRDFFVKYQDRILFGTDGGVLAGRKAASGSKNILLYPVDDPEWARLDAKDENVVRTWKAGQARFYSRHFEYFETDRTDLVDPSSFEPGWAKLSGAKLPAEVLEKFYHANAERLIAGLK